MGERQFRELSKTFIIPGIICIGLLLAVVFVFLRLSFYAHTVLIGITILGSYSLFFESAVEFLKRKFALDYIAMVAIVVALLTQEYFVAAIIALMISSGRTLEDYGVMQAKNNLTKLSERIPNETTLYEKDKELTKVKIEKVAVGDKILVKKGEVIPLDGTLVSSLCSVDESSLTGEPYPVEKVNGDMIRSGTVNTGDVIIIVVTRPQKESSYNKIIELVKSAQQEKAPLVRLADKYSTIFTLITAAFCILAFLYSNSLVGVLAVLVVATPCPLILATPIALLGGVNAASKKRIIVKKLAGLESLSRASAFVFDKTGTITIGTPILTEISASSKSLEEKALSVAVALERNSLHPLAKAIVFYGKKRDVSMVSAEHVTETLGQGIQGTVNAKRYTLKREKELGGLVIDLYEEKKIIAKFHFEEEIKEDSVQVVGKLQKMGLILEVFTGDKLSSAQKTLSKLGENIRLTAECTPEDKLKGVVELKKEGRVVAMVGDGINDAPALAMADVGIVFSNEEQTAASEAADIVFLGSDLNLVYDSLKISRSTVRIAMQSILAGIGASVICMVLASVGLIPPIMGAFLQEAIDVVVIINALRASTIS